MFLSTGLKRVRLLGMGTHFFPKNLARGMLIRVGTFIGDTIVNGFVTSLGSLMVIRIPQITPGFPVVAISRQSGGFEGPSGARISWRFATQKVAILAFLVKT